MSAYASRAGAVLAQVAAPGKGEELAAVKEVLGQVPLKGRVVVADALLTQRKVCEQIVAGGGEYLLPVKENQPTLRRDRRWLFPLLGLKGWWANRTSLAGSGVASTRGQRSGVLQ